MASEVNCYNVARSANEEFVLQAAENGDNTKLKELHEAGTAFAITNSQKRTAVHLAVNKMHFSTLQYLVEEIGLDPNLPDSFGDSAVQYASYNGHMEAVKLLVEFHNADVMFKNQRGATAADDADTRGFCNLAAYLRECALKQRYILLRDCPQQTLLSKFKSSIKKGAILRWNQDHKLVVSDSAQSSDICVKCHKEDYCCVSPQVAELLLAVQDYQQRYSLFVHKQSLLRRVVNLSLGDSVTVQTKDNTELKVVVKYRGPLTDVDGLYFGVQLQEPLLHHTTDGSYSGSQLFTCPPNCGLFISIECILEIL
ncbi:ubiquitin carboxyl-terminal hydrolase CYLD-like isoform X2 [Dysidea avara]|uniref:ubiquitin carboxyl-terminal hydrolase CYLD-like isoform X2 n=1 Tax=Dysidea avara TaxID=196820 RepID=UPI003328C454